MLRERNENFSFLVVKTKNLEMFHELNEQLIERDLRQHRSGYSGIMKIVAKIFSIIDWLFEKLNIALMAFLVVAVMITVILRYFFNISFIWAEEMILFTFIATTYFGIVVCVKEDEHIAIDFFVEKSSGNLKLLLQTFISIIGIITLLWIGKLSLSWIETVGGTLSPGMKLPYKYIYSWMPFSFTLCAIYEARKCLARWIYKDKMKEVSN